MADLQNGAVIDQVVEDLRRSGLLGLGPELTLQDLFRGRLVRDPDSRAVVVARGPYPRSAEPGSSDHDYQAESAGLLAG